MAFGSLSGTLTGIGASTGATNAITGSVTVNVGDLVFVVSAEQSSITTTGVTDNLGNTYTAQNAGTDPGTPAGRTYWSRVTSGGTLTTITTANTSSGSRWLGIAAVIEGAFDVSPLDANPGNIGDLSSPFTCPATGTLAQADEVVMSFIMTNSTSVLSATSPNLLAVQNTSGSSPRAAIGYQVVAATTTVSPEFTAAANPTGDILGTASFKKAAAAGVIAINQGIIIG